MKNLAPDWIVVADFDGTITQKDVGNELCLEFIPDLFKSSHLDYRAGKISLRQLQKILWSNFPCSEKSFRAVARNKGNLRKGFVEFLSRCQDSQIPFYIASAGLLPYIQEVLKTHLDPKLLNAILEIRSNLVEFGEDKVTRFYQPEDETQDSPYPIDKGSWAQKLKQRHPGTKILGIGNGTSDRTFAGKVDTLLATESLAKWCETNKVPFTYFEDFEDILEKKLLPI